MEEMLRPIRVLLAEDNEADVRLTREALKESKLSVELDVVNDGVEAMDYLNQAGSYKDAKRPDLIILDLNMPRKDGRETLKEIKDDEELRTIPVVILTVSQDNDDIVQSYKLHANCYITKPVDLEQFMKVVKSIEDFWFAVVKLPNPQNK